MFKIIADSTSDLPLVLREKYDIDYCRMSITCDDKEYVADLDYKEYSAKELYDWMRNGKRVFTSQVADNEFREVFKKYLDQGIDILYIACSSALSASYLASLKVRDELLALYPERKIICIDSKISCIGQGSLCIEASKLKEQGKSLEEVVEWIENNKLKFNQFATVESLEFLKRAGRVKASKAFFGNLFGIKPIIISDIKGRNFAFKKAKGRLKAIDELATLAIEAMDGNYDQVVYIGHADSLDDALLIKKKMQEKQPKIQNFEIGFIGPIVGASTGPGTLGVYVFGKEVTLDEESE